MFLPWHRQYVQYFEDALTDKCGYKGAQPYWDWTQGTFGSLTRRGAWRQSRTNCCGFRLDAHDFYHSKFFDNSSSGVGGWGDPANDYRISTGGFKDMVLAYPNPHHIRRNFTLFPYLDLGFPPLWGDDPSTPALPGDLMINTTFTKENVDYLVNNFEGDFFGFHGYFESLTVSLAPLLLIFGFGL